jgi:hypothetical protein
MEVSKLRHASGVDNGHGSVGRPPKAKSAGRFYQRGLRVTFKANWAGSGGIGPFEPVDAGQEGGFAAASRWYRYAAAAFCRRISRLML